MFIGSFGVGLGGRFMVVMKFFVKHVGSKKVWSNGVFGVFRIVQLLYRVFGGKFLVWILIFEIFMF